MKRLRSILTITGSLICLLLAPCAMAQTGTVLGFGDNSEGELGDSTTTARSLITPAYYISGVKAIASGFSHTLALDSTGTVWAWGSNDHGQLGTGDTTRRTTPVAIVGGVKAIAAGAFHSLALQADGTVLAWGYNKYGQLGTGDFTDRHSPVLMSGSERVKAIAAGGYHSLVINDYNDLYGCGLNDFGQLAQYHSYTDRASLTYMTGGVVAVAAGYVHTLVQYFNNEVWAVGDNTYGQLGDGGASADSTVFTFCASNVRAISSGLASMHNVVVSQDGTVLAWGYNGGGQLGVGDTVDRFRPTLMPGARNVKAVAAGGDHSLVLTAGGTVLATGLNTLGQLGDGTTTSRTTLAPVKNANLISAISAGYLHSVILRPFTRSLATGQNNVGQLGTGTTIQRNAPTSMSSVTSILTVAAGPFGMHSLLLKANGTVWACGLNDHGQLGQGTTTNSTIPVEVKGPGGIGYLTNIIAIAAGDYHSMALAADGTIYTWGYNGYGQLGVGDNNDRLYPVHLPIRNIYAIAAGGHHNLLLSENGSPQSILACGLNAYGQLGLGDTNDHNVFSSNEFGTFGLISLAAGELHSLGRHFNGENVAWGNNFYGQLGFGDTAEHHDKDVQPLAVASPIACGGFHTLLLNGYGQVWESGYNFNGELGLGDYIERHSWTYNGWISYTTGIACGYLHSLFLNVNGKLYASGYGFYGQLGNGTTTNRNVPDRVLSSDFTTAMAGGAFHTLLVTTPRLLIASVRIIPNPITGGTSATATVSLAGQPGPGGQRVFLSSDNSAASVPAFVDVPPTSNQATFTITTKSVAVKTGAHITASLYNKVTAGLTITP